MALNSTVTVAGHKFYFSPLTSLESGILPLIEGWVHEDSGDAVLKAAGAKRKVAELSTDETDRFFDLVDDITKLRSEVAVAKKTLEQLDPDNAELIDLARTETLETTKMLSEKEEELETFELTPAQVEAIELLKFYKAKLRHAQIEVGTHALRGQLMLSYAVIKDVSEIVWPQFRVGTPARKTLDERFALVEGMTTVAQRTEIIAAAQKAMEAGIAGLKEEEKKS